MIQLTDLQCQDSARIFLEITFVFFPPSFNSINIHILSINVLYHIWCQFCPLVKQTVWLAWIDNKQWVRAVYFPTLNIIYVPTTKIWCVFMCFHRVTVQKWYQSDAESGRLLMLFWGKTQHGVCCNTVATLPVAFTKTHLHTCIHPFFATGH